MFFLDLRRKKGCTIEGAGHTYFNFVGWPSLLYYYNIRYFSDDHFLLYSMCHYLEGIKDALSECSGLVSQNSGAVCKNMEAVEIEIHSRARGEKRLSAACWQARLPSFSRSKRYGSCSLSYHTCFKSLVASMFVQGSYIRIYFKQCK